jgi:hypothetical protein
MLEIDEKHEKTSLVANNVETRLVLENLSS